MRSHPSGTRRPLRLEPLEARLAPAISAAEQLFVYALNRARHDPGAYEREQNLSIDLDYVAPQPPLAIHESLFSSSEIKSVEMATNNYFGHQSAVTGKWPNLLAREAGYDLPASFQIGAYTYPLADNSNQIESLAAGYSSAEVALRALIVDQGVSPPGHRNHLLGIGEFYAYSREIGVGYAYNAASTYDHYWAIHATASSNRGPFATGVVFNDLNGNNRYDLNEGLAGVTVRVGNQSVTTNSAGGWSAVVDAGEYLVTASGGSFVGTATAAIRVGSENMEVDFLSGQATGWVNFERASNTAPTLDTSPSPTMPPVAQTAPSSGGSAVAALLGTAVSDPDPSALRGLAVVGLTGTSNGTWQYSLNGGGSWSNLGSVSEASARLLREVDLVRFIPAAGFLGTATISYRAWDRTSGTFGTTINLTSATGGTTAYSAAVEIASVTVVATNSAPVLDNAGSPRLADVNEDTVAPVGSSIRSMVGASITDPDPGTLPGVAIVASTGTEQGTWEYSLDAGSTWTALGAVEEGSARLLRASDLLRFIPRRDYFGTVTLSYRAWDQSSSQAGQLVDLAGVGATGGSSAFSIASETASLTVVNVNDAPTLVSSASALMLRPVPVGYTGLSGRKVADILGNAGRDVDPSARVGIAVVGASTGGTFYFRTGGSTWWTSTPSAQFALLLRDTDLIDFHPASGFSGTASLTFRLWDQTEHNVSDPYGSSGAWYFDLSASSSWGGTHAYSTATASATVFVGTVGTAPTASLSSVATPREDALTTMDVGFTRAVTGLDVGDISLTRDGVAVDLSGVTLTGSGTSYTLGNLDGVTSLAGTYVLSLTGPGSGIADAAGNLLTTTSSRTWTLTPSNIQTSDDTYSLNEDQTLSITGSGVLANDVAPPGSTLTVSLGSGPAHGTLQLDPDGQFRYTPSLNWSGTDQFTYRASDGTSTSRSTTVVLQVAAVDDPPVLTAPTSASFVVNRDQPITGLVINDPDGGQVEVSLRVDAGLLTLATRVGLIFSEGDGDQDASLTFRGTLLQVNAALASLRYRTARDQVASSRLTITLPGTGEVRVVPLVPQENVVLVQPDPALVGKTQLIIQGSAVADTIRVQLASGSTTQFVVTLTGQAPRTLSNITGRILVFGLQGSDTIQVSGVTLPAMLDGGEGNDVLVGGSANDRLTGGPGDDRLDGANGTDRLVESGDVNFVLRQGTATSNGQLTGLGTDVLVANRLEQAELRGGDGDNLLDASAFTGRTWLFGGKGQDVLRAGSGASVLLGGEGNDLLRGGRAADLLVGGLGADVLYGMEGGDLLIGGTTVHDNNRTALDLVMAEWLQASLSYATRTAHLFGTLAGGLNGSVRLNTSTVQAQAEVDRLEGSLGLDWFFARTGDTLTDRHLGGTERLTLLP
ncbi:MAG: Ig-like domain-containing protein [Gemmataceae bacterium]